MLTNVVARAGLYRHQKGGLYVVVGTVTDVTNFTDSPLMVLYWSIKAGPNKTFVREIDEFFEEVKWADGVVRPRFIFEDVS